MVNSKLLEVLSVLDVQEMSRLDAFLRSPYFHQPEIPEDEKSLFNLLYQHFPDYEKIDLAKDKVFKLIYPNTPFIKGKLDKKMSALLRRIEHFMSLEETAAANAEFGQLLKVSQFYRKKDLARLYENSLQHLRKEQDRIQKKDPGDLYNEFLMQREIAEYQSLFNTRKKDLNLRNALKSLDEFYLASKLEFSCGLLYQNAFHNELEVDDSLIILEKIAPLLRDESFSQVPLIKVYSQVYFLLKKMKEEGEDDLEAYQELERLLSLYEDQLPFKSLKGFHAICRSFYTRQFNKGNLGLQEKIFTLYKEHLEKGYLYYEGGLTPSVYKNTVSIGLRLKKYDWVYAFLQENKDRIVGTNYPQDVYHLNLANYYFNLKDHEKAKEYLVDTYDDLYYQIAARRLEIKIYFEEKSELLESKNDAFRLFLRRLSEKKLPESARLANNNFINAIKQILLPKTYKNPKRINNLYEKIAGIAIIKEKEWLLEKLRG